LAPFPSGLSGGLGLRPPDPPRRAEGLDAYFAMARGRDDVTAMEMTKWFDTHYLDRVSMEMPQTGHHLECSVAA
jgi:Cobalamin-independent synthase, N-terminal domain